MKTLFSVLAAMALVASAGSASAQDRPEVRSVKVGYLDLDLSSAEGRTTLKRRVDIAVRNVCPKRPLSNETLKMRIYQECRTGARATANAQLAALFNQQRLVADAVQVTGSRN